MTVTGLSLNGFRNYKNLKIEFSDTINVITGKNAQGKTNLIEAIFYLASGKSFRTTSDKELIKFDNDYAHIKANIISKGRNQTLEAKLFKGQRKQLFANDIKLKTAGELTGKLTAVSFCPDDLCLVKQGASVRRKLMDNALSQLRSGYANALSEFNKLYEHKTRILKDHFEKPSLLEVLDDFNSKLTEQSAKLIYYRAAFSDILEKTSRKIHSDFSDGQETLDIKYKTVGNIEPRGKTVNQILPLLQEHQQKHKDAEIRSGLCLSGAHKDDLEIEINNKPARKYASQGQARTASVSIKLAERDIYYEDKGEYPVLLLDDVLSELDEKRKKFVLGKIKKGQVFITCCEDTTQLVKSGEYVNVHRIKNGELVKNG